MICMVVGARPNFVKMAPVVLEAQRRGLEQSLVHTGQHYDERMSKVFFDELRMPQPDVHLGVGSGSHAQQTARILVEFEKVCLERRPRLVVVAGDVNSTLACALVASKLEIPVAHVESGLRSRDRSMPEEINRILTDHIADILFTTEPSGNENLLQEGFPRERIHYVGNSMIDSLRAHVDAALARRPWEALGLREQAYGLVTLHRPSNVDASQHALEIARGLAQVAERLPLVFPIHPRTRASVGSHFENIPSLTLVDPLPYLEFLGLMARASLVLTDSGGVQEETTALGVPCLTLRPNTERPVTIDVGTNRLVEPRAEAIVEAASAPRRQDARVPDLWDGAAARRIVDVLERRS